MRLWDMDSSVDASNGIPMTSADGTGGWIDLGSDGIQIDLKAGTYDAGDYWIFPARAQLGAIEWPPYGPPGPQPPMGIQTEWCPLALIQVQEAALAMIATTGSSGIVGDCRKPFPTLTGICAEDVCFDDSVCSMSGVATVQDAIDKLCQERDLRFHNQNLHGWGVVCGLQVDCGIAHGGTNTQVSVQSGYALDCGGDDVILSAATPLDIIQMLDTANAGPGGAILTGDGEVYLQISLDSNSQPVFSLDAFTPPKNQMQALLEGGIWMDIYNDCLLPIVNFWKSETTPQAADAGQLVGPTAERLITFLNLIIQLFNQTNGQYVFLSNAEDTILRNFYTELRSLLQSETYCAMFDNARQFPDYPKNLTGPVTIFGKNFQSRVRSHPDSADCLLGWCERQDQCVRYIRGPNDRRDPVHAWRHGLRGSGRCSIAGWQPTLRRGSNKLKQHGLRNRNDSWHDVHLELRNYHLRRSVGHAPNAARSIGDGVCNRQRSGSVCYRPYQRCH